jgi:DnaK suppressor protein
MEARNRYVWQEDAEELKPGGQHHEAERVLPLPQRRAGTLRRRAPETRIAHQNHPVDAVVGLARPAPVPAEEVAERPVSLPGAERGVVVPPGLAEQLRARQAELQARLARLEGEALEMDEDSRPRYSNHPADEVVALLDRAGRDAVARVLLDDIAQVDRALDRLANGSYGLCSDCGQPIPPKRLEARPTATLCVSCQGKREAREAHSRVIAH